MNKLFTVFVAFLLVFAACKNENNLDFPDKSAIVGLASPIQLTIDTTLVYLTDYFIEPSVIDSVKTEFYSLQLSSDKKTLKIYGEKTDSPLLSELQVYSKGFPYAILLKKNLKQKVTLSIGDKNYKTVAVKGEMNGWNTNAGTMQLKNGTWLIDFTMSPGKYQYLFVIDGKETPDPNNAIKESNGMGGFNSILAVGKE
ncbi:MAG TPA: hypothetical protein DCQ31_09420, partial [Bacteroidales bacterium]|nr:hypothetical protein [Bacteroidales bacterium]